MHGVAHGVIHSALPRHGRVGGRAPRLHLGRVQAPFELGIPGLRLLPRPPLPRRPIGLHLHAQDWDQLHPCGSARGGQQGEEEEGVVAG